MKNNKKVLACTMAMSLVLTSQASVFAVSNVEYSKTVTPTINNEYVKLIEKGQIPYCEFIRAVVIETAGEQPQIMDTHYAMPYMLKAKELGFIEDIPMEKWNENISRDQINEVINKLESSKKTDVIKKLNALLVDSITLNGTSLDLHDLEITVHNGNVMIPLRKVAEALGFTITWEGSTSTANIDNGTIKTSLQVGFDNYYKASSTRLGLSKPIQYGTPPMLIEGNVYVPAQLFNLLFSNTDSVVINDGVLNIISE